ncbi:MAG: hypothetical protein KAX99_07680 [Azonexus sp.]|jgi:hypothetical protein|nr:hypothetical protein [Azonexus sp.]
MKRLVVYLPALFTLLSGLVMLVHGPIGQPANYHDFADHANFLGIPYANDVLSNLGFALVGAWGVLSLWPQRQHRALLAGRVGYGVFLIGLILTALGSAYYHLAPDNDRLLWDRLPIALACAGLLAGAWAETALPKRYALAATCLLIIYAITSVFWWYVGELNGKSDLRPYLLLQILPIVLIPLWQAIYQSPQRDRLWFGAAFLLYVLAKLAELNDHEFLAMSHGLVSGHTLKHLLATAAAAALVHRLIERTRG